MMLARSSSIRWSDVLSGAFCSSKQGGKRRSSTSSITSSSSTSTSTRSSRSNSSNNSCKASTREIHSIAARESQEAIAAAMAGVTPEDTVGLYDVALKLRLVLFTEIFRPAGSRLRQQQQQRAPRLSCSGLVILNTVVSVGLASSHQEAALLCNRLIMVGALCGASGPTVFSASSSSRYRFAVDRYSLLADDYEGNHLLDGTRCGGGAVAGRSFSSLVKLARGMRHFTRGVPRTMGSGDVPGFTGRDAVDWLMNMNDGPDTVDGIREGAVATLNALVRVGAFADAAERGNFVDGATRFCFAQDVFLAAARASFRTHTGGANKTSGHQKLPVNDANDMADPFDAKHDPDVSARTLPSYFSNDSLQSSSWSRRG